jgi:hypothetical protein
MSGGGLGRYKIYPRLAFVSEIQGKVSKANQHKNFSSMYTGCLYDPAVIHKCIQVDEARSSAEAYGWELPVHDLRVLASRMPGIDVCVEHQRHIAVGKVWKGYVNDRGQLICEFTLFNDTMNKNKNKNKNRTKASQYPQQRREINVDIAHTVDHWIRAGTLRELSLQHIRDTLTPLEVSIVVAGARPNSRIQCSVSASVPVDSIMGNPTPPLHRLSFNCKRTMPGDRGATVTVMASCKSHVRLMDSEQTNQTARPMEGNVDTMTRAEFQQEQQQERRDSRDTRSVASGEQDLEDVGGYTRMKDVQDDQEGTDENNDDENNDDENENENGGYEDTEGSARGLSTSQRLGNLLNSHQQQQHPEKPESLSILATAIKSILQAHQKSLSKDNQTGEGGRSSIRASADVEEDQLAAATAFAAGMAGDGGQSDFISPHICVAARSAIDAIECSLHPRDESTPLDASTMVGHNNTLAASMWIEKLCDADKRASNQSHVHELDLVTASKTELRRRIQAMFVPRLSASNNNNTQSQVSPSSPFDVELARALTGTFRRGIEALCAHTTSIVQGKGVTHNQNTKRNTKRNTKKENRNGTGGTTKGPHVRASIVRDFSPRRQKSQVTPRQHRTRQIKRDPFKMSQRSSNMQGKTNGGTRNRRIRATANTSESRRIPNKTNCGPPLKRARKGPDKMKIDSNSPFVHLNSQDGLFMQKLFNDPKMLQHDNPGVMTLRPMQSQ